MKNRLVESILNEVGDYYSNSDNYTDDSQMGEYNNDNEFYTDLLQKAMSRLHGNNSDDSPMCESDGYTNGEEKGDITHFAGMGCGYRH